MPRTKGSGNRIQCSFQEIGDVSSAPATIVYMPEGEHTISATVNGKPKTVKVNVNESVLASFEAGLSERGKRNVRAITDFDHRGKGAASAIPKKFRYEKGRGLLLDLEWTQAGRKAIVGKDYSYFSPDFLLGAGGVPTGIAKRGPIGSLVNDPAFEDIERIAAAHANQTQDDMEILNECGLLTKEEAEKDDAVQVAASRVTDLTRAAGATDTIRETIANAVKAADIDPEKLGISAALAENSSAEDIGNALGAVLVSASANAAAAEESRVEAAKTAVEDLVSAGKIPSQNEQLKKFWLKQFTDNPDGAKVAASSLPQIAPASGKVVSGSAGSGGIKSKAAELVKAGRAKTEQEATVIAIRENPELYEEYRESYIANQG